MKLSRIALLIVLLGFVLHAETYVYKYNKNITNINGEWNKITITDDMFVKLNKSMSDIRIIGINDEKKQFDVPYFIRSLNEKAITKSFNFKIINQVTGINGQYFTFEYKEAATINQIDLKFSQKNYEAIVNIEGSNDQKNWFRILSGQRIISISNEYQNYEFNTLHFPDAKFKYIKVNIKSKNDLTLENAKTFKNDIVKGTFNKYFSKNIISTLDSQNKSTKVMVQLNNYVPITNIKIFTNKNNDFFRFINIQYLSDSTSTDKGIFYDYSDVTNGYLSSTSDNDFHFTEVFSNRILIEIFNKDDQAIKVDSISIYGTHYEIIARFTQQGSYTLYYSNPHPLSTEYDILNFENKMPENVNEIKLGDEKTCNDVNNNEAKVEPLIKNKKWLWGLMIVIIGFLGFFAYKMIKGQNKMNN